MEQKPESKEFNIDNIPGKLYSIPELLDGGFKLERKEADPETSLYKIDKEGNVYLRNEDQIKRAINRFDSYLKPLWNISTESHNLLADNTAEGAIVTKLAKINTANGSLIDKGELKLITQKGIFYELGGEKEKSPESKESIKHIYAEFIDGSEFKATTNTEADFSIFELTLLTPDTATFKISPNREKLVVERPNYLAGCEKDIESDGKYLITKKVGTAHKSGDKWIIDSPLDVQITKKTKNRPTTKEITGPEISNNTESVVEVKDENNKDLEKQKKIDEIYRNIMEMIRRNTESLLKEQKLEEELAQLIASDTKKEVASEPAKKIEAKPFSFNIEFIKNKIQEIIANNEGIKEIEGFSIVPGPNNEFILNVKKITAEFKFVFTFTTDIVIKNAHIMNFKDGIKLNDNYEITATNYEKKVKDKMAKNIDKISDAIKEIVEKEVNKKVEKIWIENGELKAL